MAGEIKTPANFDEAYQMSTEAMLAEQQAAEQPAVPVEEAPAPETVPAEAPVEEAPAPEAVPAEGQAPETQPALTETQILQEAALRTANELASVKSELEQLKALSAQQSQAAEEEIQEQLLEPPKLDLKDIAYLSDEEIAQREAEYTQQMLDFTMQGVDKKIQPVLSQYESQQRATEEQSVLNDLRLKSPDFDTYLPEIQSFLSADNAVSKALAAMPARERYVAAALMAKGAAPVQQETAESLVKKIAANPDAMRMLELQRVEATKKNSNIPPQSASSGMANVPVNPPATPKSFDEAHKLAKEKYGF